METKLKIRDANVSEELDAFGHSGIDDFLQPAKPKMKTLVKQKMKKKLKPVIEKFSVEEVSLTEMLI